MTMGELRNASIPPALRAGLKRLLRRYRLLVLLKGLSAFLTVFLLGMFLVMGLDRIFIIDKLPRWGLSLAVWTASAFALWRFLISPLARVLDPAALAASVEADHPELAEELSSSVELVTSSDRREFRGSDELINAVVSSADHHSRSVDFTRVVHTERARRLALVALFLLLLTGFLWVLWKADFSRTFARFAAPWTNLARVSSTELGVLPGDVLVARGDSQLITAVVREGAVPSNCWLYLRTSPLAPWTRLRMESQESGQFSHLLANVDTGLEYHLRAGDALTQDYTLSVADRPAVASIDVAYDFPPYTGLSRRTERDADGDLRAVVDSSATLTFHTNKPLTQGQVEIVKIVPPPAGSTLPSEARSTLPLQPVGPLQYSATLKLDADGSYTLALRDENGFANSDSRSRRITAVPDASPLVEITEPYKTLILPRPQPVDLALRVEDDFNVAKVELVFEVNNSPARRKELPLKGLGSSQVADRYQWMLVSLGLRPGDTIRYSVEASDNHPGQPNVGASQTQFIRISYADLAQEQAAREQVLQQMREQLNRLIDALKQARDKEDALVKAAEADAPKDPSQPQNQRAAQNQLEAAQQTSKKLAAALSKDPVFNVLKPTADEIAQTHIPNAKSELAKMDPAKKPSESRQPLDNARTETQNALDKAEAMQRQVEELAKLDQERMKLADLSNKEANLAQETAKNEAAEPQKADDLANQQQNLQDQLNQMMKDADRDAALAQKADDLKKLADALDDIAKREQALKDATDAALAKRLDDLAKKQEALNKDAADRKPDLQPALDKADAGNLPEKPLAQAAKDLNDKKPFDALQAQRQAEDALKAQQDRLQQAAAKDPQDSSAAKAAEQVKDLAQRQEQLRKELSRLMGEDADQNADRDQSDQDKQMAAQQQDIKDDTSALADKMAEDAADLAGADADMGKTAEDLAKDLQNNAADKMGKAADSLGGSRMKQASGREQEALDALKKSAGKLGALNQSMQQALAQRGRNQQGDPDLASALGQMRAAQAQLRGDRNTKRASQRMSNAADKLARAATRALGRGNPLQPTRGNPMPGDNDTRMLLQRLGLTLDEWNHLPGELRQEILEGYDEKFPSEYRKLIRQYFREISDPALHKE